MPSTGDCAGRVFGYDHLLPREISEAVGSEWERYARVFTGFARLRGSISCPLPIPPLLASSALTNALGQCTLY